MFRRNFLKSLIAVVSGSAAVAKVYGETEVPSDIWWDESGTTDVVAQLKQGRVHMEKNCGMIFHGIPTPPDDGPHVLAWKDGKPYWMGVQQCD